MSRERRTAPDGHRVSRWCRIFGHRLHNDVSRTVYLADDPCLRPGCDGPNHRWTMDRWEGESVVMVCVAPGCDATESFVPPPPSAPVRPAEKPPQIMLHAAVSLMESATLPLRHPGTVCGEEGFVSMPGGVTCPRCRALTD